MLNSRVTSLRTHGTFETTKLTIDVSMERGNGQLIAYIEPSLLQPICDQVQEVDAADRESGIYHPTLA